MGGGSYSVKDWTKFSTSRGYDKASTKTEHIYSTRNLVPELDPAKFQFRESVDSAEHPETTPIIIGLDVTGSMSYVLDVMARQGMKTICEEIYKRKPVTDPHICSLGIGDVEWDTAPLQATQFEADIRIFEQLEKLYLEKGGGGNNYESYILAWYFAAYKTKTDSFKKRGKKGFIFTIGDEQITPKIESSAIFKFLGQQGHTVTAPGLFDLVSIEWNVFHVIVKEGNYASHNYKATFDSWASVISPQHILPLDDHKKVGEVIVSALEVAAGKSLSEVAASWDGSISVVVGKALENAVADVVSRQKDIDSYL